MATNAAVAERAHVPAPGESRLARNVMAMVGGQAVTWTMSLTWTLVVPRALGAAGMGIIVAAWSVTGVLGLLLGLGTRNYLVRELVVRDEQGPSLVGTALVLRLLLSPLFVGAALVYARFTDLGPGSDVVLYLAVAATIFVQLAEPLQAAFQAMERMEYIAYSEVISKSSQGLLGVAIALVGFGAIGIAGCWAAMTGLVVIIDVIWLRMRMPIRLRTTARRLTSMMRESVAYWAGGVFFTIYLWIDALMLSLMTTPEVVGWYGVPMKLFQTFMFLPMIVSTAWLPRLVRTFVDRGPQELRGTARRPLELVVLLGLPIAAGIAVGARPFVTLVYGPDYSGSVAVLELLALSLVPMYANMMLSQVLIAAKQQVRCTWLMAGSTVVNPLLNLALIPATEQRLGNGAVGASVSLLLTELGILVVAYRLVGKGVLDGPSMRRIGRMAGASAATYPVARVAAPLGLFWPLPIAGVTLVALVAALRIVTRADVARLWEMARGAVARRFPRAMPAPAPAD